MSAVVVQQMGLPIRKLICASNQNNVLSELINTGYYNVASRGSKAIPTISPAIDIVRASNVERYVHQAVGRNGHFVSQAYRELENTGRYRLPPQVNLSFTMCVHGVVWWLVKIFCHAHTVLLAISSDVVKATVVRPSPQLSRPQTGPLRPRPWGQDKPLRK